MKNRLALFALTALAIGSQACNHAAKEKQAEKTKNETALQLMTLQKSQLGENIQLPGTLQPYEYVQIFPKVNGFVKNITVDRGSRVRKGQLLIELEAPEMQQSLAAAKLRFAQAQAVYETTKERYQRLLETNKTPGVVSPFDLSSAKAKMNADMATMQAEEADYKARQAMNTYLTVVAPFDGIITERNVHPGALVGSGNSNSKPMLVIQQQDKLRLVVNVPEEYSSQLSNGSVQFTVNALPGETFSGKVARSSGCLSDNYRTEAIEIDVPNNDHKFMAGMYAEVQLPSVGNAEAYVVPKSAVVTTTERKYVIAVRSGKTQWLDVTQGNESADSTEIFGALQPGDRVVVKGSYEIKEGKSMGNPRVAVK